MPQRHLQGGGRAGGEPDHIDLVDAEVVQQGHEGICLVGRSGLVRQRRAEVPEPGRGDHPPPGDGVTHRQQPTVGAVEDAVADQ
jgi:hypothetical protein